MITIIKRLLHKSLELFRQNSLRLYVDSIEINDYTNLNIRVLEIAGWFHTSKKNYIPELVLITDKNHALQLNIHRPDVAKIYGNTTFQNGFAQSVIISRQVKIISVRDERSGRKLYNKTIHQNDVNEIPDFNNQYLEYYQQIPQHIKEEMEMDKWPEEMYLSRLSYERIFYHMLKTLSRPQLHIPGYNVFAYVSGVFGLSEAARGFIDYLLKEGQSLSLIDIFEESHAKISPDEEALYKPYYYQEYKYDTNLILTDTLLIPQIMSRIPEIFENKKNAHAFWWEFESGFEDRIPILNQFDEIIVFSDFIKNVLHKIPNRKFEIRKIKYPFYPKWEISEEVEQIRTRYHLTDKFCFFFNFDYASGYHRKNPEATLLAFYQEFNDDRNVVFVYKTNKMDAFNEKALRFQKLIKKYQLEDRVLVISDNLNKNEFMSLLNAMNCYVSLHRGEGLGLGILEALALEIPVIATNYGGNTENMDHPLAYPVDYTLVPAHDDYLVYSNVKNWAEPDIKHAQSNMRSVYDKQRKS